MHHPFCDDAIITANSHRNVTGRWFFTLEMSQFCDISKTFSTYPDYILFVPALHETLPQSQEVSQFRPAGVCFWTIRSFRTCSAAIE
jgi:hypothetical protein